jgi:lysyl-tRNA synthetase, class II
MSDSDQNAPDSEHRLIAERRGKLDELREQGFAFPNGHRRTALAGQLAVTYEHHATEALAEEAIEVSIGGRLMVKRVMGKASFIKLQDRSGQIQVFVQRDAVGEDIYKSFKRWDIGDIIGVSGTMFRTKTDELSVKADGIELLTKSLRPLPEKFHGLTDLEMRYRQRYVDLIMNEDTRRVFRVRT